MRGERQDVKGVRGERQDGRRQLRYSDQEISGQWSVVSGQSPPIAAQRRFSDHAEGKKKYHSPRYAAKSSISRMMPRFHCSCAWRSSALFTDSRNVFFATIVTDLCRYFFEDDGCLAAFQDNSGVSRCGNPVATNRAFHILILRQASLPNVSRRMGICQLWVDMACFLYFIQIVDTSRSFAYAMESCVISPTEVPVKYIISFILILTCGLFSAEANTAARKVGFVLLREGVGARSAAMGDAQTAVVGDQTVAVWNPAGVAAMRGKHFVLAHHRSFQGIKQGYGGWAYGNDKRGIALSLGVYGTGGLEARREPTARPAGLFSVYDLHAGLSYAQKIGRANPPGIFGSGVAREHRPGKRVGDERGSRARCIACPNTGCSARRIGIWAAPHAWTASAFPCPGCFAWALRGLGGHG